jgi:hypothetical protein
LKDQAFGQPPLALIGLLLQGPQFLHLLAQLGFQFSQPLVTDRLALGGIGVDRGAVPAEVPQLQDPRCLRQQQGLDKPLLESRSERSCGSERSCHDQDASSPR